MYTYVVIDDEPLIRRGILKKLENYPGIQCVAQASNGKAALEQIEEKDPDFVITDMKMPIMDGTQLLPVLSTQYPEKYIIVISGYKDFDYAKEALRAKTLDYIVKPFSREALCSAVDKAVELLQSRETLQEKITLDEAKKEKLKYEYDRQILRNVLFGTDRDVSGLTSQKAREIQNGSQYVLLTVTMQEKLDEKVLSEFLLTRDLDVQTVLFTRDHTENMCFLLLAFPKEKSVLQREIMDIKNMLDDFFKSISGHPFYGISGVHKSLGELHKAFLETTEAMNQMTLEQKVNYVFYAENKENGCVLEWPKLELFLFLVESGKKDEMETVFPELFHYFARNEKCRLKDAKDYCLEITETLKKSLPKDMQIHKSTATSLNLITNLNFIFSFSELEEYFQRFFRNMSMAFESVGFYSEKDILENIKNYVDFHYEKDLTQEFVASLFRLNRSYLSSAFKARTGTSFVDYVNQVRISHAKEMLKKTDKKTYQIAQAVGYENAKYFFRVFKKMEGITPEQYRNQ